MAKRKHECPEPDNTERWAVSYLDMITVMMCLFLVLYAISTPPFRLPIRSKPMGDWGF